MSIKKPAAKGDQSELKKRLEEVLRHPDNATCADCPERGPRWASATLGTFICIKCSGIHRNLGVHISFVRSVNLDEWKVEHVEQMERWGNGRARAYYEAEVPPSYAKPTDWSNVQQMTRWIKDKYEYKRFLPRDGSIPDKSPSSAGPTAQAAGREAAPTRERKPRERPGQQASTDGGLPKPPSDARSSASSSAARAAEVPAPPKQPQRAPVVDLLDFNEPPMTVAPSSAPPPVPPQAAQQVVSPQQQQQQPPSVQSMTQQFAAFGVGQQQQQQPQPAVEVTSSGKPKLTPDQLLSMFNSPPAPQPGQWGAPAYGQPGMPPMMPPMAGGGPMMQQQQQPQQPGMMPGVPAYGMPAYGNPQAYPMPAQQQYAGYGAPSYSPGPQAAYYGQQPMQPQPPQQAPRPMQQPQQYPQAFPTAAYPQGGYPNAGGYGYGR